MTSLVNDLCDRIRTAAAAQSPLRIEGGNTKQHLGRTCNGASLPIGDYRGITEYEPNELVITARAGTPLTELSAKLSEHNQELGFEPPDFAGNATIGGTLATNLSGPARPWSGSVRDAVLGIQLINGQGEHLRFGGKVIKNVAGFDASRLQAGAYGSFGVITEISLKVRPLPEHSLTMIRECDESAAIATMNATARTPIPLNGAAWHDGRLYLRFSGNAAAVTAARRSIGGEELTDANEFWADLRNQTLSFFRNSQGSTGDALWRLSVNSTAPLPEGKNPWLLDWCGSQRFVWLDSSLQSGIELARSAGGSAIRMNDVNSSDDPVTEPHSAIRALYLRLKNAFDPAGILNRGRLYSWL